MEQPDNVAVLGIGIMGAAMARNLKAAGFEVRVWNRSPGPAAALAAMKPGSLWIQMATVGISATEHLHAMAQRAGVDFVDAPVIGTRQPVEEGTLTILASGPEVLSARCAPIFDAVGERTIWLQPVGQSSRLKLVANQWSTGMICLLAETVTLARQLAVDPMDFFNLVNGLLILSVWSNWKIVQQPKPNKPELIERHDYDTGSHRYRIDSAKI